MESQRQKKISSLIQKEVAELISLDLRKGGIKNLIISEAKDMYKSKFEHIGEQRKLLEKQIILQR